uniref:Two component transcriptional regulator, winged helix family n=1 Tax=uncultured bacterium ws085G8 TaxID=1131825 RepID=I1X5C4_9BACT|nr:two component transcriptional regulator, winged helix family [uncultured bacterium ws085G8]
MSEPATILIVEDEAKIASLLRDYLEKVGGYQTHWVDRGDEAVQAFEEVSPQLVLLDLMLPGMDGLEVCKAIRMKSQVPVIMVTALVEEIDRLLGLELGADDYICKPFSPREVVARVKAVLRRADACGQNKALSGLQIDEEQRIASINNRQLKLSPVEFALLGHLAAQPGRVFSRDQLMSSIYSDYRIVSDRTVDTHVKNLRRKLEDSGSGTELIESVYGVGYRLAT